MDWKCYVDEIKKINNSIATKLGEEANNFHEFHKDIRARLHFKRQCQEVYEEEYNKRKKNIDELKTTKTQLEKELEQKSQELFDLKNAYNLAINEGKMLRKEYETQACFCKETIKQTELSQKDKDILKVARKKYELCKEITNIVWDYTIPCTAMFAGYVRNKSNGYIHPFEFKKSEMTHSELVENVWKEVEMGQDEIWTDIIEMTDKPTTGTENVEDKENK